MKYKQKGNGEENQWNEVNYFERATKLIKAWQNRPRKKERLYSTICTPDTPLSIFILSILWLLYVKYQESCWENIVNYM